MQTERISIDGKDCLLFTAGSPRFVLVQPTARHEAKNDGIYREAELIIANCDTDIALAAFDVGDWARALMPWADAAVSKDKEVGCHAADTLRYVQSALLPRLRSRFGDLPCVIGGYSLGGLFALWAAREADAFCAVAAASPSLWIRKWGEYASTHPMKSSTVFLSLGDREEHCRNQRMKLIGDCVRSEHSLLLAQPDISHTTLEWNPGGHFGAEAERTARAFCWCVNNVAN